MSTSKVTWCVCLWMMQVSDTRLLLSVKIPSPTLIHDVHRLSACVMHATCQMPGTRPVLLCSIIVSARSNTEVVPLVISGHYGRINIIIFWYWAFFQRPAYTWVWLLPSDSFYNNPYCFNLKQVIARILFSKNYNCGSLGQYERYMFLNE